jgi:hypothetical protein
LVLAADYVCELKADCRSANRHQKNVGETVKLRLKSLAPWLAWLTLCAVDVQADEKPLRVAFAIESQPVAMALNEFARQAHLLVLRRDEDISLGDALAPRIEGELSPQEALKQILSKTDLTYEFVNERTVKIARPAGSSGPLRTPLPKTSW